VSQDSHSKVCADLSEKDQPDLCIISFPLGKAFTIPISNLSRIFSEFYTTQVIIGSYDPIPVPEKKFLTVHVFLHKAGSSKLIQVIRYFLLNMRIILEQFSLRHVHGQTIFFPEREFIGCYLQIFPAFQTVYPPDLKFFYHISVIGYLIALSYILPISSRNGNLNPTNTKFSLPVITSSISTPFPSPLHFLIAPCLSVI